MKETQRDQYTSKGLSMRMKLWIAYGLLILVAIIVAVIALQGFLKSRAALEDLRTENLPEIASSLELADQSSTLAAFAPFLGSVRVKSQLEAESARLQSMLTDFSGLLQDTLVSGRPGESVQVDADIAALADDLTAALLALVENTNKGLSVRADALELDHALRKRRELFEQIGDGDEEPVASLSSFHRLTEIAFQSGTTESTSALNDLKREYDNIARALTAKIQRENPEFSISLSEFIALQRRLFEIRVAQLDIQNQSTFLISTANALSNELSALVKKRVARVTEDVARRGEESAEALDTASQTILLLTVIGGFATAAVVFFVLKDLGGNLSLVTQGMSRLSQGDTSVSVPGLDRKDEIGSLSRAFKVFREHSIENARMTDEISNNAKTLEAMFQNMTDGLSVFDDAGSLLTWNPQFLEMHNIASADIREGMSFQELVNLILAEGFVAVTSDGQQIEPADQLAKRRTKSTKYEHHLGEQRVIALRSQPLPGGGFVTTYSDQTDSRAMEKQLRTAQRMDAIGQMTGGVAHDFNNLLSIITGNLQLLHQDLASDAKNATRALRALDASERGASLTQRLLAFTSQQALKPEPVQVDELVMGLRDLFETDLDGALSMVIDCEDDLPAAFVDPGQLETALINLLYNARDAVADDGEITFRVSKKGRGSQGKISISVGDNGQGISSDVLSRVYEPFFTTKASGYGTGLGLSMVYGFVKQSGGEIHLDSAVGHGTTVSFELPSAQEEQITRSDRPSHRVSGDGEQILLVEDDQRVRETAVDLLEGLGYRVVCKSSLGAAKSALSKMRFDLLFTDVMLADDETGLDVASYARSVDPDIGVVFTSGFGRDEVMKKISDWPEAILLSKPYRKGELAEAIQSQIHRSVAV